jgi:hypothetical protein
MLGKHLSKSGTILVSLDPKHDLMLRTLTIVSIVLALGLMPACDAQSSTRTIKDCIPHDMVAM